MSKETLYLQDQVSQSELDLSTLHSKEKQLKTTHSHLSRQSQEASLKILELQENIE